MSKKVLGKGLAALIPEKGDVNIEKTHDFFEQLEKNKREQVVFLNVKEIKPNKYQPRTEFDDEKLAELVKSIKEKGVVQPILVRHSIVSQDGTTRYELIVGERRLRAVKFLGIEEIPALIKDMEDRDALEFSLIENLQREDLNPIEEAFAYQRLMTEFKFDHEKIAQVIGKDRTSITNTLRLLKLPKKIQDYIVLGQLSAGHGRAILGIEKSEAQLQLCETIISKELSVRETEALVRKKIRPATSKEEKKDALHFSIIEEELQHVLGTKVKIIRGKKVGKIEIEFYSEEDLNRILTILKSI